ncbi:hypothetical protein [Daejeonella sp.]|uniref:HU domain-containing protein n=1 Tax=Daejeonella sp. TaxID=2805397 RepID=UPI003982DBD5
MDIGFYIADLLQKQDKVSVSGLGTFTRHKVPGSYDHINNLFLPPSYKISFSDEIFDSQSLSKYISAKKNLSPSSAEYFIKKFTSGFLDILQSSGIAKLNPLGNVRKNNENLTFEASPDFEITGQSYGMKPVSDLKSYTHKATDEIAPEIVSPGGFIEDFITGQGSTDEIEEGELFFEEKRGNSTGMIILGAFLFAVVTAALFYILNPTTRNLVDRMLPGYHTDTPISNSGNTLPSSPIVKPDSLSMVPPAVVQDSSIGDSVTRAEQIDKQPVAVAGTNKIEIIGATFGKRSEAEAYVIVMKKRGIQAKIADDMPGRLFKVSLASFSDDQSAQTELNRVVKEVEKTAWIAKYKSKKTQ